MGSCKPLPGARAALLVVALLLPLSAASEHVTRVPEGEHLWAQRLLYAGDLQGAIAHWERGLHAEPDNAELLSAIGAALHLAGRDAAAVPYLRRAVRRAPQDWTLALFFGSVLHDEGNRAEARAELEKVAERAPNRGTAQLARDKLEGRYYAHVAQSRKQSQSAGARARTWSAQLVHVPWALHNEGRAQHFHDDGSPLALLAMAAAASRGLPAPAPTGFAAGDYIELHHRFAISAFSYARGRYVVAVGSEGQAADAAERQAVLELLDFGLEHARAVMGDPRAEGSLALKLRSLEQLRADDRPGAMGSLREALREAPGDLHARRLLASLHALQGEERHAKAQLSFILAEWPSHPQASTVDGALQLRAGLAQEARETLRKAIVLKPTMWHAYADLAKALLALERPSEAITVLEHVVAMAPHMEDVGRQLSALRGR